MVTWKLVSLATLALFVVSEPAFAQAQSAGRLSIASMSTSGEGCDPNEVATYVSPDSQAFTLTFDNYNATLEAGKARTHRKACEVSVKLNVSPGWSFSIVNTDARGYAALDAGISGVLRMFSSMERQPFYNVSNKRINGEYFDDYESNAKVPVFAQQWSSCSQGQKTLRLFSDLTLQRLPSNSIDHASIVMALSSSIAEAKQTQSLIHSLSTNRSSAAVHARLLIDRLEHLKKLSQAKVPAAKIRAFNLAVSAQFKVLEAVVRADKRLKNAAQLQREISELKVRLDYLDGLIRGESFEAAGLMTVDTLDGEITQKYGIAWKRCR